MSFSVQIRVGLLVFLIVRLTTNDCRAQDHAFLNFVRTQAAALRAGDSTPENRQQWSQQKAELRSRLLASWGGFPDQRVSLEPRVLETLNRDGYRIEKIVFQTYPDVWMTANAYVPDTPHPVPAVLCVHGHWPGAKQDPHVQARCIGLTKLGYFVLAVDAMGAGERGLQKHLGEYHGEMVAATLWPTGRPLSGLQVYENMRAVDYLISRKEVDGTRIGITGASGGGNQTMYAGAWDERFRAVVPVCSVGTYQAYLGAACCMCEVVPGAISFTEEGAVLALVAPRSLLVISATRDAHQFSVGEAAKSIAAARPIFEMLDAGLNLQHAIFDSPHDYNQPMREAMYGWMHLHLKGEGDGSPIREPEMSLEDPETLRCFPGNSRPENWKTLPEFAADLSAAAENRLSRSRQNWSASELGKHRDALRVTLDQKVLASTIPHTEAHASVEPPTVPLSETTEKVSGNSGISERISFLSDPGIRLSMDVIRPQSSSESTAGLTLLVTTGDESPEQKEEVRKATLAMGGTFIVLPLRATGPYAWPSDRIGRAPDHNTAEWSLWIGRPLLGQWVKDIRTSLQVLRSEDSAQDTGRVCVVGLGTAGVAALAAAAIEPRIDHVVIAGTLSSFVTDRPFERQRLGTLPPGILPEVGDIPLIASLVAPRRVSILQPVDGQGVPLMSEAANRRFQETQQIFREQDSEASFRLLVPDSRKEANEADDTTNANVTLPEFLREVMAPPAKRTSVAE